MCNKTSTIVRSGDLIVEKERRKFTWKDRDENDAMNNRYLKDGKKEQGRYFGHMKGKEEGRGGEDINGDASERKESV